MVRRAGLDIRESAILLQRIGENGELLWIGDAGQVHALPKKPAAERGSQQRATVGRPGITGDG